MQFRTTLGIGELARLTRVPVRTIRFYCDTGILTTVRSTGGHRRFAPDAVDQLTLVRRLRGLGLGLPAITDVLAGRRSMADAVAAARAELDVSLAELAWRRASLVAVEQSRPTERAARLDLLTAVTDSRAAHDTLVEYWRRAVANPWPEPVFEAFAAMVVPDPPAEPTAAQVMAYAQMVTLTANRLLPSLLTEHVVDQHSMLAGVDEAIGLASPLVSAGTIPGPGPVLDQFVAAHAVGRDRRDSPAFRQELLTTLASGREPGFRRYWGLYAEVTGETTTLGGTHIWLLDSLAEAVAAQH
ncbi:MerR family transcriptional regulator [Actinocrispum wychmicini]|uniref:DNA-binding transcriptional MerR regulator n=1 Tax=Actinocrispum wychmicini TaxID=1213861 RepID=A0A4R2JAQ4_9PSEU|nr:MerR family transcriptional regulator [Actinocrispum wychmicini]TCO54942.1 DNA-binding transcriptional MerR regulator [Actinocrispum wychmicini]